MALHPGRQRSSAAPIITKGLVYPLQNRRASKSATHGFASKLFHIRRKPNISLNLFDSKVFRNFVDAFSRGALLAHHFGSVDRLEPAKAFLREEGGTRSVTEGAYATLKSDETLL